MNQFEKYLPAIVINRPCYLQKALAFKNSGLIKLFLGQRRVGKSYMLFQVMKEVQKLDTSANLVYISKEHPDFQWLNDENSYLGYITSLKKQGDNYLFIDEVQEVEGFVKLLRGLLVTNEWNIWCTGSNAVLLSQDVAGLLSGRVITQEIHPLNYREFLTFHQLSDDKTALEQYLRYGGLPHLMRLSLEDDVVYEYLKGIYATILFKDVVARHGLKNIYFLEQLVTYCADTTGSLLSAKKISDFLVSQKIKIAPVRVLEYLRFLTEAFFLKRIRRFDLKGKRILEVGEKYYFADLGLRQSIIGFRVNDLSKILENAVMLHMQSQGFQIYIGTLGQKEIDFVCERNHERIYLQVALRITDKTVFAREFGNLKMIDDNYPKYVVTFDDITGNTVEGIIHINLSEFLKIDF
ncbi:MAG: ATP-binding protein [Bacteroidota bacterium]